MVTKSVHTLSAVAVLIVALTIPTLSMQAPAAIAEINDPEAYAVYASVLPAIFSSGDRDLNEVILFHETRPSTNCFTQVSAAVGPQWSTVLENYKAQNSRGHLLRPDFNLGLNYRLVSLADLDATIVKVPQQFLATHPGTQFYTQSAHLRFPNQKLYFLSAVGFNENKTRAFLTVQYECGFDCGGGRHYAREKVDGHWDQPKDVPGSCQWVA